MRALVGGLMFLGLSGHGWGQDPAAQLENLKSKIRQELQEVPGPWPEGSPGTSALVPSAFGGKFGAIGIGVAYQNRVRYSRAHSDGLLGMVVPLGDPYHSLGVDVTLNFLDLSRFGDRSSADVKLHLRRGGTAIAIGYERALINGFSDGDRSLYLVGSHILNLKPARSQSFSRLTLNAGIGTGRYRTEKDVFADRKKLGVFGSAAINLCPQASVFGEWTGQDADAGLSFSPLPDRPLTITVAATDIGRSAGDGTRWIVGAGYVFRF